MHSCRGVTILGRSCASLVSNGGSQLLNRYSLTCGAALLSLAAGASAGPRISDAWVRALPPTQSSTAGYLRVHNDGDEELVVIGASADIAGRVEIHTTVEVDGLLRMQRLPELRVPAGGVAEFAPGGAHLMLLELSRMPAPGQEVRLCLQFASAPEACTVAPASKGLAGDGAAHHHH